MNQHVAVDTGGAAEGDCSDWGYRMTLSSAGWWSTGAAQAGHGMSTILRRGVAAWSS
jgi:hypothetical protein